ncbi:MAG: PQQ-binding-like beta-propeller repeat protein [Planctomycetes bacterium]|nr:PQQ-binding-like beta-propeller repeat protein [Planctomycetota bacterium]
MKQIPALVFVLGVVVSVSNVRANDWPSWRGPEQNGASRESAPVTSWSVDGENLLWKSDVGGRTTPIVMNNRLYAITPVGEGECRQERVVCLDAATGKILWEHRFNVFHTDIVENRVGWTAVVGDPQTGNVYAHGTGGEMFCFSGDGDLLWKRSMTEELGRISGYGGRLHTPIIDEDRVIVSFLNSSWGPMAKPTHRWVAFDKRTGEIIWWAAPGGKPLDTTYSCPVVAVIGGKRMLIAAAADGNVYGMLARSGERVWSYKLSKRGLNTSIVVEGDYAYVTHSEENLTTTKMGAIVCIDASKRGDLTEDGAVWRHDGFAVGYASPALANGRLYVMSNAADLMCFDAKTGKQHWTYDLGRVGKGSPTVTADGVIYIAEQTGVFHILKDEGDKCVSLDSDRFVRDDNLVNEIYGSPVVANGRVYFMTRYGTYCLGSGDGTTSVPVPTMKTTKECIGIYIVPGEVTVAAGESVKFELRQETEGCEIDEIELSPASSQLTLIWLVKGGHGEMSQYDTWPQNNTFTAKTGGFGAGVIELVADYNKDDVIATARIRVCPKPPFAVDFEDMKVGSVPPGWVGVSKKTDIVDVDGGKVLRKIASKKFPSPPFMRLRAYAGPPIEGGYTVQCDVMGRAKKKRFKPDMGLINSRYRLVALGNAKKLRVESWAPMPRVRHDVKFEYKPDVWYTMKFQVEPAGGKAHLRGRIWPRGEAEPEAWLIDVVDSCPNTEGSPGLYAYSANTTSKSDGPENYYDNFKVMNNE